MFEWLWKSKDWVFSGIGVPVAVGIFLLFRNQFLRKNTQPELLSAPGIPALGSSEIHNFGAVIRSRRIESKPSGNEIAVTVDDAPPFQRKQIGSNYIGLAVSWPITFFHLHMLDQQRCALTLSYGNETWGAKIELIVDINDYARLKTAREPDLMNPRNKSRMLHGWIEGKIVQCGYGGMRIEPTKLEFFD